MTELQPPIKRSWVKLDKYIFDFFDYHEMAAQERFTVMSIALETQWQDRTWTGSLTDLSGRTKITRGALKSIISDLSHRGILRPIRGFSSNSVGQFELVAYEDLIIPDKRSGGRPYGSKDGYPRERTLPKRTTNDNEVASKRASNEDETTRNEHIEGSNYLMNGGKPYNSPREAERREVGSGAEEVIPEENQNSEHSATSPQSVRPATDFDEPCGICGEREGGHPWASSNGQGHDWVPSLGYRDPNRYSGF